MGKLAEFPTSLQVLAVVCLLCKVSYSLETTGSSRTTQGLPSSLSQSNGTASPLAAIAQARISCKTNSTRGCHHGVCYERSGVQRCDCGVIFAGKYCERVNLRTVDSIVYATSVTFMWSQHPGFVDYVSAIYQISNPKKTLVITPINMTSLDTKTTIYDMTSGAVTYVVCLAARKSLREKTIKQMLSILNLKKVNCVKVKSGYDNDDPYTKTAFAVSGIICGSILVLILLKAIVNCQQAEKRERILSEVMGRFDFLRRASSKKYNGQDSRVSLSQDGRNGTRDVPSRV